MKKDNEIIQTSLVHLEEGYLTSSIFLLNYFLYVYGLELVMQLVVLGYSFFCYDEIGEPYWVVMIDLFITLLMLIEVRSHYLSRPEEFWLDSEMRFDTFVGFISVLFIVLYFLAKEGVVEWSEELDTVIHICRETTRILKLPTFIRNFKRMIQTISIKI